MIDTLKQERLQLVTAQRSLLDRAEAEKRDLTGSEKQSFDQVDERIQQLDQRLHELEQDERRERVVEDAFARLLEQPVTHRAAGMSEADRDLDIAIRKACVQNDRRPIVVRDPAPRSGYSPALEMRSLATTSGSGLLGTTFYGRLIRHLVESSAILSAGATVVTTSTGESLKVPRSTALSSASIIAEGGTIPSSDPTLGSVTFGAYKYGFLVQISYELAQDAGFDVIGFLAEQAGIAIGNAFGAHAVTGTGSSQPTGVVTGATTGVTGGTGVAGAFTADNLIDLQHSIAEPYLRAPGAAWLMRSASLGAARKLKDSQGRYLFDLTAPAGTGAAGTLLGKPVFLDPNVAAVALSAKSVAFGDMSRYWVRQVNELRFERSDDYAFNTDLITFRCLARLDGAPIDASAVKVFAGGAS